MKAVSIILGYMLLFIGQSHSSLHKPLSLTNNALDSLKAKKVAIDNYLDAHNNEVLLLAKVKGKKELVVVKNKKWPDDTECSYDVLKDKEGNVIFIMQSPTSESGDWDLTIFHYFYTDGHTFAYEKQANAFVLPDDGVAYETTTNYFDNHFKIISHQYKLVDKKHKDLSKEYAFDREDLDSKQYATVSDCLKAYGIKLPH